MSHYYTFDPNVSSNKTTFKYTFKNKLLTFFNDNGVFSKDRVDFGTNVLLNSLDEIQGKVLDVGCGCGVIGICIASSNPLNEVTLIDVNKKAIELTLENILLNKITNANAFESDLYSEVKNTFDYIITNPPIRAGKKVVSNIIIEGFNYLNIGGKIIAVIQKKQGALSLKKLMEETYKNCQTLNKEKGYYVFMSQKVIEK